ncbi:MAG: hypothetical protein JWQ89_3328 [Devosia sp.]|nr:hypothetical protein [Devosia sp.]
MTKRLPGLCFMCQRPINRRRKDKQSTIVPGKGNLFISEACSGCWETVERVFAEKEVA